MTGASITIDKATACEYSNNTVEMRVENKNMDEFIIEKKGGTINWTNMGAAPAGLILMII